MLVFPPPTKWGFDPLVIPWYCHITFRLAVITFILEYGDVFSIERVILFQLIQDVKNWNFPSGIIWSAWIMWHPELMLIVIFFVVFYYCNEFPFYWIIAKINYILYLFYCMGNSFEFTLSSPRLNLVRVIKTRFPSSSQPIMNDGQIRKGKNFGSN